MDFNGEHIWLQEQGKHLVLRKQGQDKDGNGLKKSKEEE